ncbi:MAG: DUF4333 domain-containing protein [Leptolyngbyaceae cyanobacterium SL_7_1]|nr:DUF4333 domain-containing protein [Leptolyngbyaceae cyanobacterium SL_7_1]
MRQVEAAIQQDIEGRGGIPVKSVECPGKMPIAVGEVFQCQGELAPAGEFIVTVEQQDDYGNVAWDIPSSKGLLNVTKLEALFQEQLGAETESPPVVNCGGVYRVNVPGDSFECKVLNATTKTQARIEAILVKVDTQGNVSWQQVRRPLVATNAVPGASPPGAIAPAGSPANPGIVDGVQPSPATAVPPAAAEASPTTSRARFPNTLD